MLPDIAFRGMSNARERFKSDGFMYHGSFTPGEWEAYGETLRILASMSQEEIQKRGEHELAIMWLTDLEKRLADPDDKHMLHDAINLLAEHLGKSTT